MESRYLEVEDGAGVFGINEVVRHGQVDGHRNRPGPVWLVATVDGNGLIVH